MPFVTFEIPVELGTIVYEVTDVCHPGAFNCPYDGGYGFDRCEGHLNGKCKAYYEPVEFTLGMKDCIGKFIFLTEAEAQKEVNRLNKKNPY